MNSPEDFLTSTEPEDRLFLRVLSPAHDISENRLPSSAETPFVVFSLVSGVAHRIQFVQGFEVRGFLSGT